MYFVEALLSLVGALVSTTSGCTALSEAGLVPALLPLLRDRNPAHINLVSSSVRILEAFMDFSPSGGTLFRDLGGLSDMIERLQVSFLPNIEKYNSLTWCLLSPGGWASLKNQGEDEREGFAKV